MEGQEAQVIPSTLRVTVRSAACAAEAATKQPSNRAGFAKARIFRISTSQAPKRPADKALHRGRRRRPRRERSQARGPILRSEEHTSELQSLMRISYAVFCLKKKHK